MNWDSSTLPIYVAWALKQHHDRDVALSVESDGTILDIGIDETNVAGVSASYPQSAIINLLQRATADVDTIAVTADPDERDLGMARMLGVTRIMFLAGPKMLPHRRTRKQPLVNAWNQTAPHRPTAGPLDTLTGLSAPDLTPTPRGSRTKALDWFYDTFDGFSVDLAAAGRAQIAQKLGGTTRFNPPRTKKGAVRPILESSGLADLRKRVGAAERLRDSARPRFDDTNARQDRARRGRYIPPPDRFTMPAALQPTTHHDDPWIDELFMRLAFAIVGQTHLSRRRLGHPPGHAIGSVLRGSADEILGWSINTRGVNRSFHGEVNCLQNHFRQPGLGSLGDATHHVTLYTTLEPCFMCAGMYKQSGPRLSCYYGQADPLVAGKNALGPGAQTEFPTATTLALERELPSRRNTSMAEALGRQSSVWRNAIYEYFALLLDFAGGHEALEHTTNQHRRVAWENGLRLLCHVDPQTERLWDAMGNGRHRNHITVSGLPGSANQPVGQR